MVAVSGNLWTLAPSLRALIAQTNRRWPGRSTLSDGSIGDLSHSSRTSDHNPADPRPPGYVDAVDITEDFDRGPNLPAFWQHLIDMREWRLKYAIYEGRIVKSYVDGSGRPAWVPQTYTGPNAHSLHMHVSVTPAGRFDTGPWFPASEPAARDFTAVLAAITTPTEGDMFLIRRVEDGTIALGGPGLWRDLNPEQAGVASAITRMDKAVEANARQYDVARDLCLTGFLGADELAARISSLVDAADPGEVLTAVKRALREGTG